MDMTNWFICLPNMRNQTITGKSSWARARFSRNLSYSSKLSFFICPTVLRGHVSRRICTKQRSSHPQVITPLWDSIWYWIELMTFHWNKCHWILLLNKSSNLKWQYEVFQFYWMAIDFYNILWAWCDLWIVAFSGEREGANLVPDSDEWRHRWAKRTVGENIQPS